MIFRIHSLLERAAGDTADSINDHYNEWEPFGIESISHDCAESLDDINFDCEYHHVSLPSCGIVIHDTSEKNSKCRSKEVFRHGIRSFVIEKVLLISNVFLD